MLDSDVTDKFHHVDGLTNSGSTKQPNLAAFCERADQVDNLDASFKQFCRWRQFRIFRGFTMDFPALIFTDITALIDRLTEYVHDTTEGFSANRDFNRRAAVNSNHATLGAISCTHGNGSNNAVAKLLLHFKNQVHVGDV